MHDSADNSNWSNTLVSEASDVKYDARECKVTYHWQTWVDGSAKQDVQGVMYFAQGKKVGVVNREQEIRQQLIDAGRSTESGIVSPPVWVVTLTRTNGLLNSVNFTDQDKAEKVVRAIDHAMELCNAPREGF
jgi:hypothetical protein